MDFIDNIPSGLMVFVVVILCFWCIALFVLPFVVLTIKSRSDAIERRLTQTNELLESILRSQTKEQEHKVDD